MEGRSSSNDDSLNGSPPSPCGRPKSTASTDPAAPNFQHQGAGAGGSESSAPARTSSSSGAECHGGVHDDDDMPVAMALRRKLNDCALGSDATITGAPQAVKTLHASEDCADSSDEGFSDDDDLCSCSESSDGSTAGDCQGLGIPAAAGVVPPVLPDIQLRVPMDGASDVRRVKDALLIKGVVDVVCDVQTQTVTITGTVAPLRLLRKARQLKPQARIISTLSPFAVFVNPAYFRSSAFPHVPEEEAGSTPPIDIPSPHPGMVPNFVVHQHRPRPTFQRYSFRNDPASPYLRTFSPSALSPDNSPPLTPGDAFDSHFFDDYDDDGGPFPL